VAAIHSEVVHQVATREAKVAFHLAPVDFQGTLGRKVPSHREAVEAFQIDPPRVGLVVVVAFQEAVDLVGGLMVEAKAEAHQQEPTVDGQEGVMLLDSAATPTAAVPGLLRQEVEVSSKDANRPTRVTDGRAEVRDGAAHRQSHRHKAAEAEGQARGAMQICSENYGRWVSIPPMVTR
jgi:hypothetical protein